MWRSFGNHVVHLSAEFHRAQWPILVYQAGPGLVGKVRSIQQAGLLVTTIRQPLVKIIGSSLSFSGIVMSGKFRKEAS
jgi:hypothetical protein